MPVDPTRTRQLAADRVGRTLDGKWHLDALLGVGGSAAVYAATHRNGKRGAVKILHTHALADDQLRTRFLREGYVANKIAHPGAVSVLDDDTAADGTVYLVMELLEGRSLERLGVDGRPMSMAEVVRVGDDLLDVLAKAHAVGIVHRDIKPANLFVTNAGQLKVLDFGIARLGEPTVVPVDGVPTTQTGLMMGTPAFMPPEQARGRWNDVDARSDVWAVGATMVALILGRRPRMAETGNEELLLAMTEPMPPATRLIPALPPSIGAVLDRAMAFQREERWASASAMQEALRRAARESEPSLSAAPTLIEPRRDLAPPNPNTTVLAPQTPSGAPPIQVTQIAPITGPISSDTTSRAVLHSFEDTKKTKRGGGGIAALLVMLVLLGLGGVGAVLIVKRRHNQAPPKIVAVQPESSSAATPPPSADPLPSGTVIGASTPNDPEPEPSASSSTAKKPKAATAPRASGSANPAKYFDSRF